MYFKNEIPFGMCEPKPFQIYLKSRKLDDYCKWQLMELMAIDVNLENVANKVKDLLAGCLLSIKWWNTKRYKQDTCGIV